MEQKKQKPIKIGAYEFEYCNEDKDFYIKCGNFYVVVLEKVKFLKFADKVAEIADSIRNPNKPKKYSPRAK